MTIQQVVSAFCQAPLQPFPLEQLCQFIKGDSERKAFVLLKIFGSLHSEQIASHAKEPISQHLLEKVRDLFLDFRIIIKKNYRNLASGQLSPMPKASWNRKMSLTDIRSDGEYVASRLTHYLDTSEMPKELSLAYNLRIKLCNNQTQTLYDILKEGTGLPLKLSANEQINVCKTAAFAHYPRFISFFEALVEWRTWQPKMVDGLFSNCNLLQVLNRPHGRASSINKNAKKSFHQFVIQKTQQQIWEMCPLPMEVIEEYTKHLVNAENERRVISFFLFFLKDLCSKSPFFSPLLNHTHEETTPFRRANLILQRLCGELSFPTILLLKNLIYVAIFDWYTKCTLTPDEKCEIFAWAEEIDEYSPFERETARLEEIFAICLYKFKKQPFTETKLRIFSYIVECQYFLDLGLDSLEFLISHLKATNYKSCLNEVRQYVSKTKVSATDPLDARKEFLKTTMENHQSVYRHSVWKLETYEKENGTLDFLKAVENCSKRTLPADVVTKVLCYPFYKKSAVTLITDLNNCKMQVKPKSLFLVELYDRVSNLIADLREPNYILGPGRRWLTSEHACTIDVMLGLIGTHLQNAVFAQPFFLSKLIKDIRSDFSCPENVLTFFGDSYVDNLAYLAEWHLEQESSLELTFLFSMENPKSQTIIVPLPLTPEEFNQEIKLLLCKILKKIVPETSNNNFSQEFLSDREEFAECLRSFPDLHDAYIKCSDPYMFFKLFLFAKRLKVEARYAIATLFNDSLPESNNETFMEEAIKICHAITDRNPTSFFLGEIGIHFHPKDGRLMLSINGYSYTIHYGDHIHHRKLKRLVCWQLQMLHRKYSSQTLGARAVQEE